jgi:hypothetical protein
MMICKLIEQAVWLNVHVVPVPVFEIRVQDGYGARWSADGSQVNIFYLISLLSQRQKL